MDARPRRTASSTSTIVKAVSALAVVALVAFAVFSGPESENAAADISLVAPTPSSVPANNRASAADTFDTELFQQLKTTELHSSKSKGKQSSTRPRPAGSSESSMKRASEAAGKNSRAQEARQKSSTQQQNQMNQNSQAEEQQSKSQARQEQSQKQQEQREQSSKESSNKRQSERTEKSISRNMNQDESGRFGTAVATELHRHRSRKGKHPALLSPAQELEAKGRMVTERAQEARQKVNMRHAEVNAKIAYRSQHQVATELHSSGTPVATELSRKGKHPKPLSPAQKCCLAKMWECCRPVTAHGPAP